MTKPIEDYTLDELSAKIEAIKAEREKTANALKKYEEEMERRKHEVPFGVPLTSSQYAKILGTYYFGFSSDKAKKVFDGCLKDYVEALQKLARGEPIDVKAILPLLRKGWVAMDRNKRWYWYSSKPNIDLFLEMWKGGPLTSHIGGFNLKPAENWETSLMECGL